MPDPNVFPRYVRAPSPTPEQLPPHRVTFYSWLGARLLGQQAHVDQPQHSVYLTAEEMKATPSSIWSILTAPPAPGNRSSLAIIDLATNPYHLLRDIFLMHVAEISARWLQASPRQKVAILLPLRPPPSSVFWLPLAAHLHEDPAGRVAIIANDGNGWPGERADRLKYVRQQLPSTATLTEQLESRVIRKVGHFPLDSGDEPHCTSYFFETEEAEREIGELVVQWVGERVAPTTKDTGLTLVSHGWHADRFHDAVSGAAAALDFGFVALRDGDSPDAKIDGTAVLVFDVVDTESTVRRVVESMLALGMTLAPEALVVLKLNAPPRDDLPVRLRVLSGPHHRNRFVRSECRQCHVKLPHTPPKTEAHTSIRAYDMWNVFLRSPWRREGFGPKGRPRFGWMPDMGRIFAGPHGPWIAYKVGVALRSLNLSQDVVFVCPEEPNIAELLLRLGLLLQNRQVTVEVPRDILNRKDPDVAVKGREQEAWYRQLSHLGERSYQNVVMLDEFTLSHTTARSLLRLLQRRFDLDPAAYIPIVDFSPGSALEGVRTVPLYRLPHPRGLQ